MENRREINSNLVDNLFENSLFFEVIYILVICSNSDHGSVIHRIDIFYWGKKWYSYIQSTRFELFSKFRIGTHSSCKHYHLSFFLYQSPK